MTLATSVDALRGVVHACVPLVGTALSLTYRSDFGAVSAADLELRAHGVAPESTALRLDGDDVDVGDDGRVHVDATTPRQFTLSATYRDETRPAAVRDTLDAVAQFVGGGDERTVTTAGTVSLAASEPGFGGWHLAGHAPRRPPTESSTTDVVEGRRYEYDADGVHVRTVDDTTGAVVHAFDVDDGVLRAVTDSDGRRTTFEYGDDGSLRAVVAADGRRTVVEVREALLGVTSPSGAVVGFEYDEGRLVAATDGDGRTTRFEYGDDGRLALRTDPDGAETVFTRTDRLDGSEVRVVDADVRERRYRIERFPDGLRQTAACCGGAETTTVVNRRTGERRVVRPDGLELDERQRGTTTEYRVETPGGVRTGAVTTTRATEAGLTQRTVVDGRESTTRFDRESRTWTETSPTGRRRMTTLDEAGRVVAVDGYGVPVAVAYDERGRPTSVTVGSGDGARITAYEYDGPTVRVTDPSGTVTTATADADDRPVVVETAAGEHRFEYDAADDVVAVTTPGGARHRFERDGTGRVRRYRPPASDAVDIEYDASGNRTRVVTGGRSLAVTYDDAGRPVEIRTPDESVTVEYDGPDDRPTRAVRGEQTLAYAFDGPLPVERTYDGPVAGSVHLGYGDGFRLASVTVGGRHDADSDADADGESGMVGERRASEGETVRYAYDEDGLVVGVGGLRAERDGTTGRVRRTTLGVVTDEFDYSPLGDPVARRVTVDGDVCYERTDTVDASGRVVARTERVDDAVETTAFAYDDAGRLVSVTSDDAETRYEYDADGNRTRVSGPAGEIRYEYDDAGRLVAAGDERFTYASDGSLRSVETDAGVTTFDYDALGGLRSVRRADGTAVDCVLDGEGRRVGTRVDGVLHRGYLYDADGRLVAVTDGSGRVDVRAVYGVDGHAPDYLVRGGRTYRLVCDRVGTPRLLVDSETGETLRPPVRDPFGVRIDDDADEFEAGDTDLGWLAPFGFADGLGDPDLPFVRFGARDYDPRTGRWTAPDPLGVGAGPNRYAYASNDPVNRVDPDGRLDVPRVTTVSRVADGRGSGRTSAAMAAASDGVGAALDATAVSAVVPLGTLGGVDTTAALERLGAQWRCGLDTDPETLLRGGYETARGLYDVASAVRDTTGATSTLLHRLGRPAVPVLSWLPTPLSPVASEPGRGCLRTRTPGVTPVQVRVDETATDNGRTRDAESVEGSR